jgi:hypothetical protein
MLPKLKADISSRTNLLRIANFGPAFSNRARRECGRFAPRLGHGALACLASDPPTTGRMGELRDNFPEHNNAVFAVPWIS